MNEFLEQDLTDRVIGAAIEIHRHLGPGFLESIYEEALAIELRFRGINFDRQRGVSLKYRDQVVGEHRLDMLVDRRIVVELKAIKAIEDIHFAVVRSYMKAIGVEVGLILNFAAMPLGIKRVGRELSSRQPSSAMNGCS